MKSIWKETTKENCWT